MLYYVVCYTGPFGFIKPWTAVRDSETFSLQFLTPSVIEGIRQKLEVATILRHKLRYGFVSVQQEKTQSRNFEKKRNTMFRNESIISRGILVEPELLLAFENKEDALKASRQHICLCRNEDILLPDTDWVKMCKEQFNSCDGYELKQEDFDSLDGYELKFGKIDTSFLVGYNRFDNASPMYGYLEITGKPLVKF